MLVIRWTEKAEETYNELRAKALDRKKVREESGVKKSSTDEGLFKQVAKTVKLLGENTRHPGLQTHEYSSMENPFDRKKKVFEAYAQNQTPGAYRVFWCYGPGSGEITIIAITPHP